MSRTKAIFLKGWINPDPISQLTSMWMQAWKTSAEQAKANGMELVVFQIPTNSTGHADPETVEEIELLLQKKFPQYANQKPTQDPE